MVTIKSALIGAALGSLALAHPRVHKRGTVLADGTIYYSCIQKRCRCFDLRRRSVRVYSEDRRCPHCQRTQGHILPEWYEARSNSYQTGAK